MDESKTDEIQCHFADVTAQLEDASTVAVEGQSRSIDQVSARQIISALRQCLDKVEDRLMQIESLCKPD